MKKMILALLITFSAFADNTGWSGRILANPEFNDQVRTEIVKSYKSKCGTSSKDFELPPIVLVSAKESTFGYLGTEAPVFTVTLRTFSAVISDYVEQNFDIEVQYNSLLDKFKVEYDQDFNLECID